MYPPHVQSSDAALHAHRIGLSLSPTNAHIKLPLRRLATVKMSKRQFGTSSASSSKKSIVWSLFDDNCIDASKVTCRLCNAAVSRGGMKKEGVGTTNLWTHLDRKHKSDAARLRQEDSSKKFTSAAVASQPSIAESLQRSKPYDADDRRPATITRLIMSKDPVFVV